MGNQYKNTNKGKREEQNNVNGMQSKGKNCGANTNHRQIIWKREHYEI